MDIIKIRQVTEVKFHKIQWKELQSKQLLDSKRNNQQNKKVTYGMGEKMQSMYLIKG